MITSVYLSNNNIQILTGTGGSSKAAVKKLYSRELGEGCLINGVITGEPELLDAVGRIWDEHHLPRKQVSLVIDSTQFMTRVFSIPILGDKKAREVVQKEFADLRDRQDLIYDYMELEKDSGNQMMKVLGTAAERSFVDGYVKLFEQLGIQIVSVVPALYSQIRLLQAHPAIKGRTCIVQLLDGDNLVSTLMVNGSYVHSNRSRIFSEHGSPEFAMETARNISAMVQFNLSEKSGFAITDVYMGGFTEQDLSICMESARVLNLQGAGSSPVKLNVGILPQADNISLPSASNAWIENRAEAQPALCDFVYPAGNLLSDRRALNLYNRYRENPKARASRKKAAIAAVPYLILIAVLGGVTAFLYLQNYSLGKKLDEINAYLNDAENLAAYEKAQELRQTNSLLAAYIAADRDAWESIQSYPRANSQVVNAIRDCGTDQVGITITSYQAGTGSFQFTANAADAARINEFIDKLRVLDIFANVEYSGYGYQNEEEGYRIHVSCYLDESAGK